MRIIISSHCDSSMADQIRADLRKVGSLLSELSYDLRDNGPRADGSVVRPEKLSFQVQAQGDKLIEALNLMQWIMGRTGKKYAYGVVLSKDSRSTTCYTIQHSIRAYLNELCQVFIYLIIHLTF